jgi:nucleoside-diphosphate kinase
MAEGTVERTLVLVKPDGVRRGVVGEILSRFERKQLRMVAGKLVCVPATLAETHYQEHRGKPFYDGLVAHITSAPVFAFVLEGRSAISVVRLMTGPTNPQTAAPGTIRGDLGLGVTPNLIHASDSPASSEREIALFFQPSEFCEYDRTGAEYA